MERKVMRPHGTVPDVPVSLGEGNVLLPRPCISSTLGHGKSQ